MTAHTLYINVLQDQHSLKTNLLKCLDFENSPKLEELSSNESKTTSEGENNSHFGNNLNTYTFIKMKPVNIHYGGKKTIYGFKTRSNII